jgi:molecular chaperone DnaK (HSP70)
LLCLDLFSQIRDSIDQVLNEAKMQPSQIDNVIMVGGSTQTPRIHSLLKSMFKPHQMNGTVDVTDAVVRGTALQAAILTNGDSRNITVSDILAKPLGTPIQCGLLMNMVAKNCQIPNEYSMNLSTVGKATNLAFRIYEGEKDFASSNAIIREYLIDLTPNRKTTQHFQVKLKINANGICEFFAVEPALSSFKLNITETRSNLTKTEIIQMLNNSVRLRENEEKMRRIKLARTAFLEFVSFWKKATADEIQPSDDDKNKTLVHQKMKTELEFLETNKNLDAETLEKRLLVLKEQTTKFLLEKMLTKLPPWIMSLYKIQRKDLQNEYLVV